MAEVICERCGASFTPHPSLLERFPGWAPRTCDACFRASKRGGGGGRAGAAGGRAAGGDGAGGGRTATASATSPTRRPARRSGAGGAGEEHLTLAQVLERYTAGPDTGVFTDGSSIPNPGPGGWGAVYVVDGEVVAQDHGHDPQTTNNRMELRALHAALELIPPGTPVTVYTDSNLAVRTLTEWAAGWERRGWTRKTGPVENLDLVRPLYEALRERPEIELVWIKAHVGNRWNEYADSLATAWARDEL